MKVDSIDVIAGLEDSFYNALNSVTYRSQLSLRGAKTKFSRYRYSRLGSGLILRDLMFEYRKISQDRKRGWARYGAPIGLLARAAFFQHNYARVALGIPVDIFAPLYLGNIVKNYAMIGNPPPYWFAFEGAVFLGNGHLSILEGDYGLGELVCEQELFLLPDTDYVVSFDFHFYDPVEGLVEVSLHYERFRFLLVDMDEDHLRLSHTFTTPSGVGFLRSRVSFWAYGVVSTMYINDVSVIEV